MRSDVTINADDDTVLRQELDRISLEQALLDAEVAAARTADLTQRLLVAIRPSCRRPCTRQNREDYQPGPPS